MTYTFKLVVEPDGDRWHAYCPALAAAGAATWGCTREEALRNIQDVVRMVADSMVEDGDPLPTEPSGQMHILAEPQVAVIARPKVLRLLAKPFRRR
jgi:predicted RNase H-like HicB family nuclease